MYEGARSVMGEYWQSSMVKEATGRNHLGPRNTKLLSENGLLHLEVITGLLFKNYQIAHCPMMINVTCLLLLIMKPGEVFQVM
jgi:hypothetical protein